MMVALYGLRLAAAEPPRPTCEQCEVLEEKLAEAQRENDALRGRISASGSPQLPGSDSGNRVGLGEPVHVPVGAEVDDAVVVGHDVVIDGRVRGDAVSVGGSVRIGPTGLVAGDAVAVGGQVEVAPGGEVRGQQVHIDPQHGIDGTLFSASLSRQTATPSGLDPRSALPTARGVRDTLHVLVRRAIWALLAAGLGMMVLAVFPRRVRRIARDIEDHPMRAAVIGSLASLFLLVFSALFTIVTLGLGSPVALVLVSVLLAAWVLGSVALCLSVGDRFPLFARMPGRAVAFLVGVVLVAVLASLPWVGWAVGLGVSVLAVGAALSSGFGAARPLADD